DGSLMSLEPNPLFVRRDDVQLAIAAALKAGQTAAITGMGGIGKTQLAAECVHRFGRFFAGGVFWFNFADPKDVPRQVAESGKVGHLDLWPPVGQMTLDDQIRLVRHAWAT